MFEIETWAIMECLSTAKINYMYMYIEDAYMYSKASETLFFFKF